MSFRSTISWDVRFIVKHSSKIDASPFFESFQIKAFISLSILSHSFVTFSLNSLSVHQLTTHPTAIPPTTPTAVPTPGSRTVPPAPPSRAPAATALPSAADSMVMSVLISIIISSVIFVTASPAMNPPPADRALTSGDSFACCLSNESFSKRKASSILFEFISVDAHAIEAVEMFSCN